MPLNIQELVKFIISLSIDSLKGISCSTCETPKNDCEDCIYYIVDKAIDIFLDFNEIFAGHDEHIDTVWNRLENKLHRFVNRSDKLRHIFVFHASTRCRIRENCNVCNHTFNFSDTGDAY